MARGGEDHEVHVTILTASDSEPTTADPTTSTGSAPLLLLALLAVVGVGTIVALTSSVDEAPPATSAAPATSAPVTATPTTIAEPPLESPLVWEVISANFASPGPETYRVDDNTLYLLDGSALNATDDFIHFDHIEVAAPGRISAFDVEGEMVAALVSEDAWSVDTFAEDRCATGGESPHTLAVTTDGGTSWETTDWPTDPGTRPEGRFFPPELSTIALGHGVTLISAWRYPAQVNVECVLQDLGYDMSEVSEMSWDSDSIRVIAGDDTVVMTIDDLDLTPAEREAWDDLYWDATRVHEQRAWTFNGPWSEMSDLGAGPSVAGFGFGRFAFGDGNDQRTLWSSEDIVERQDDSSPTGTSTASRQGNLLVARGKSIVHWSLDGGASWESAHPPLGSHQPTGLVHSEGSVYLGLIPNDGDGSSRVAHRDADGQWYVSGLGEATGSQYVIPIGTVSGRLLALSYGQNGPVLLAAELPVHS
ncbi:MAG: hypothetical protein GY925_24355 [Actinomycetia bacterium]|nr:hypothetical protein [Actinomycetes bacterium]